MTEFKKIFVDTAIFIYFIEKNPLYFDKALNFFSESCAGGSVLVTSAVTVEEYCVHPCKTGEAALVRNFFDLISELDIQIESIDERTGYKAAQIRAKYGGFKAMDALQLATAVESRCDMFLTNDKQLRQFDGLKCLTLDDIH